MEACQFFLAEHNQQGRRWVMPMRLPDVQPSDAMYKWNEALENPEEADHLAMLYAIGRCGRHRKPRCSASTLETVHPTHPPSIHPPVCEC